MRDLLSLAAYAIRIPGAPPNVSWAGAFDVPCPATAATLRVIASATHGWDHVSVSHRKRCPNWPEMSRIKSLFFRDDECAMQLHVPVSDHVNNHAFCLHLFRPHREPIPRPPSAFVGVAGLSRGQVRALSAAELQAIRVRAMLEIEEAAHG